MNTRGKKPSEEVAVRNALVAKFVKDSGYDLYRRLPNGFNTLVMEALGLDSIHHAKEGIRAMRRKIGIISQPRGTRPFVKSAFTGVHKYLFKHGLIRASNKETPICHLIMSVLRGLPRGGIGLLIGTPTPLCVSSSSRNGKLIRDNLQVAEVLNETTVDPMHIVVGNGIDENKANVKVDLWKSFMDNTVIIKSDVVDRDLFSMYVARLAATGRLIKVVLLTSGVWKCCVATKKKYNLDLNFEAPSLKLTTTFPNLHILAMCKVRKNFGFVLRHLHNGSNIQYTC